MDAEHTVDVTCENLVSEQVRIAVIDTGTGITEDALERIFMPFERLAADQCGIEGTGLGLAMVKQLVTAMGGRIGAHSVRGRGSTFWIDLQPAELGTPRPFVAGRRDDAVIRRAPTTETILYVEDNPANVELLERIFARRPATTLLVAVTGADGMALARQHQPSLILLDLNLPDTSGEAVFRQLRADPRTSPIPIIVVSADASAAQVERLLSDGAAAYVTKPLDISRPLEVVDAVAMKSTIGSR